MTASTVADHNKVAKLLADLRDAPVNTEGASDNVLGPIYTYLMSVPSGSDSVLHWFCHRATQLTIDAATFLIRLFAYNSARVDEWKRKLKSCLAGCCDCVLGLEVSKLTSRNTYFGAFSDEVLRGFYQTFDSWEVDMVLEGLSRSDVSAGTSSSALKRSLTDSPSAAVYHILSNMSILKDPRILSIIHSRPPKELSSGWPTDPPPPGLLVLMMDENAIVRQWAYSHISKATQVPIAKDKFYRGHEIALESMLHALTSNSHSNSSTSSAFITDTTTSSTSSSFSFSSDPTELWSGFCSAIRYLPPEMITSNTQRHFDVRRIVTGHLHDTGTQFVDILRCLLILMKRVGSNFWLGEGPEFPQIVFDAVKDNPSYCDLLCNIKSNEERPWFISWFSDYLQSVRDPAAFSGVLAKIIDLMCEELQHERFKEIRPKIMAVATRLLSGLLRKVQNEDVTRQRAVANVLDIHAEIFVAVAFGRAYGDSTWNNARTSARDLIMTALVKDVQDISEVITQLCRLLAGRETEVPLPSIRTQMWRKVYDSLQTSDADGIAVLIGVVARSAHLDELNRKAFTPVLQTPAAESAFVAVNKSMAVIRDGIVDAVSKYAGYNVSSSSLLELLRRTDVVKDIVVLMLSPVESLQVAAQTLVKQTFDVDMRLDCFRALLVNLPDAAFDGIFDFLDTFIKYAPVVPEACSLSKSLVRCLTDVIEVLCSSHDGLLHDVKFLRPEDKQGPASVLPKLWSLMAKSITVIFKRTPLWSTYFENNDMTVWMRDALIYGRDMLSQRRAIETAASAMTDESMLQSSKRKKLSPVGKKMVNDLQDVLPELARWLRLTDEELLHQSFSLLQSLLDCFRESQVSPSPVGIAKLQKHIDDARKKSPSRPQTRLDSTRLTKLEDALAWFESDDDDVQIISPVAPGPQYAEKGRLVSEDKRKKPTKKILHDELRKTVTHKTSTNRRGNSDAAISRFTDQDQRKLDATISMPTFRKASVSIQSSSSTARSVAKTSKADPKDEAKSAITSATEPSSSEESDSDEESQTKGLAALDKLQRSPAIKKPAERRQVKMLDIPTKGRSMRNRISQREDARKTALRLKPDISNLHRALLSWNYDHQGSEPPSSGDQSSLIRVPDTFSGHDQYRRVFEPLLLLECWSQVVQSKEELPDIYDCKIVSRRFIDDWLDLDAVISDNVKKDWYLNETDIVLLRHSDGSKCILAKVQSRRTMLHGITIILRCFGNRDPGLHINTTWKLSKVFSLSTLHREYAALSALPYYDLYETILRPQLSSIPAINPSEVRSAMTAYKVNEPQAIAILSALQTEGFALVQGPPGTGKTSTICGMVEAFLQRRPRPTTAINAGRTAGPMDKSPSKKILLCAPSNAAIDEVAHRIKDGFRSTERRSAPPKVVRVGAEKSINISAKDISLDYLVEQRLNQENKGPAKDSGNEISGLRAEIEAVKRQKLQKQEELSAVHDNAARILALEDDIKKLNARRMTLTQQVDRLKDQQRSDSRTLDAIHRRFRDEILHEADVICSTLSGAGHEILEQFDFEMVIIDEAAQAIELSSLIPLKYRCTRCVMVGDPQQLPPTVLSQQACKLQYNQSLFVRLQKHRPDAVHLLSIQYRMHPDISQLPSRIFYQGRLQDGPDMSIKTKQPWHAHPKFGTYRFFNIAQGHEEQGRGHSLKNTAECQVAVALYARLRKEFSNAALDFRVGIVSMYRAQIQELRRAFEQRFGTNILGQVDFNTVDGFQGQEKDVIILSCVRAGPGIQSVGFLADTRRMNVAITRARSSLFILGNAPTLERSDETWKSIIDDARARSSLIDADTTFFTTPVVPVPRPQIRSKKASVPVPTIPADLSTPRELKDAVERGGTDTLPKEPRQEQTINGAQVSSDDPPTTQTGEEHPKLAGQKRPGDSDLERPPLDAGPPPKKPRPPAKRPKRGPNLFLPKPNKRPGPGNAESAGPSSNKRRL